MHPVSRNARAWAAGLLLGVLPWLVAGCGSQPARPFGKLEGKVTLDGTPVRIGTVVAVATDESAAGVGRGEIGEDGTYAIEKAPAGEARVYLELPPLPPEIDPALKRTPLAPGEDVTPPSMAPPSAYLKGYPPEEQRLLLTVLNIPKHYLSRKRSPVLADVQDNASTTFHVKLSTKSWVPPDPEEAANPDPDHKPVPPP
jgi:hypothetical protein